MCPTMAISVWRLRLPIGMGRVVKYAYAATVDLRFDVDRGVRDGASGDVEW